MNEPPDKPPVEWFAGGVVDPRKFDEFLLSPTHPVGKHKLRLWCSVFGIGQGDGVLLEGLIRDMLVASQADPEEQPKKEAWEDPSKIVRRWEVVIPRFEGPNGNVGPVLTAWALAPDEEEPRLATAYPIVG